jgi:hypothetical protein
MPKQCIVEGCGWNVFTHGYCKKHAYLYYKNKPRIPKQSDKRKQQNKEYEKIKKRKIQEAKDNHEFKCWFCDEPFNHNDIPDLHHAFGREGDKMVDERFVFLVHNYCHVYQYHVYTYKQLCETHWYERWLDKIKTKLPQLWEKEMRRFTKK